MNGLQLFCWFVRAFFVSRAALAAENLALRQQLAVLKRATPRPRLRWRDRLFWVCLARLWAGWRQVLVLVQPQTVLRWHRLGFRLYWRWKSRLRVGRPAKSGELRALIRLLARQNPRWGNRRIRDELRLLGYQVSAATVARYRGRRDRPPSQTWRTFLKNHVGSLASMDFFVVPTATFGLLYGFLILRHDRRRVVHFNVTAAPTSAWVAQQLREAFPYEEAPRYLIRDRDGIYGDEVRRCLKALGVEEVLTAPRSPWQNPYCERLIGTLRRELLDHVIVLGERHLMRLLRSYFAYYHQDRPHQSLKGNSPEPRAVEPRERGRVIAERRVGGLHHRYRRVG
jgi:transposase InsO family protein